MTSISSNATAGGGPYASSFAAAFPDRCAALILLVPYALAAGREAELTAGMAKNSVAIVQDAITNPYRSQFLLHIVRFIQRVPHGTLLLRLGGFSRVDCAAVKTFPDHAAALKRAGIEGTKPGIKGAFRDLQVMASVPMPDTLDRITCKTVIWAGAEDVTCPPPMARLYEELIPTARGNLQIVPGKAHFLGFQYGVDVLASALE